MFKFLKRKIRDVYAPVDGQLVALESVPDAVFSQKMVGDGVAIKPIGSEFVAPIDGVVSKIFATNHAYSIKSDKDLEVMVHIGLDTVALDGRGFERIAQEGDSVKVGDVIIKANLHLLQQEGKDTITPIILTDSSDVKHIEKKYIIVKANDKIMEVH